MRARKEINFRAEIIKVVHHSDSKLRPLKKLKPDPYPDPCPWLKILKLGIIPDSEWFRLKNPYRVVSRSAPRAKNVKNYGGQVKQRSGSVPRDIIIEV